MPTRVDNPIGQLPVAPALSRSADQRASTVAPTGALVPLLPPSDTKRTAPRAPIATPAPAAPQPGGHGTATPNAACATPGSLPRVMVRGDVASCLALADKSARYVSQAKQALPPDDLTRELAQKARGITRWRATPTIKQAHKAIDALSGAALHEKADLHRAVAEVSEALLRATAGVRSTIDPSKRKRAADDLRLVAARAAVVIQRRAEQFRLDWGDAAYGATAALPAPCLPAKTGGLGHMADAVDLNTRRRALYDRLTGGRSNRVMTLLIWTERLAKPVMWLLDCWASQFNRSGIAVIEGDFVPMTDVKPVDTPPERSSTASRKDFKKLGKRLARFRREAFRALIRGDFERCAHLTHTALLCIEAREEETNSHFAMTRHLLESIGLGACNSVLYDAQSHGKTSWLCRVSLILQTVALLLAPTLDRGAQAVHALGFGIIANDVPPIPFVDALNRPQRVP